MLDTLRFEHYEAKSNDLILTGLENGDITEYPEGLKEQLTKYYISLDDLRKVDPELVYKLFYLETDYIPLSSILLSKRLCVGRCYLCSYLLSKVLGPNCFLYCGDDKDISLNPEYIHKDKIYNHPTNFFEHCVVYKCEEDGEIWIYDPTMCLKIKLDLYLDCYGFENGTLVCNEDSESFLTSRLKKEISLPIYTEEEIEEITKL